VNSQVKNSITAIQCSLKTNKQKNNIKMHLDSLKLDAGVTTLEELRTLMKDKKEWHVRKKACQRVT